MRKIIIAGNWKMNKTPAEAKELAKEIAGIKDAKCEVVICPPFVDLFAAREAIAGTKVRLGAQNVHWEEKGAFTGEISPVMLSQIGVEYVIVGHSERRQFFGETDASVNLRAKAAVAHGLKVILCVGEVLAERQSDVTKDVITRQIKADLKGFTAEEMKNVVIAYEPVWAIGTGLTATPEQAQEVCKLIRDLLASLFGAEIADEATVQYGGSMNAGNAASLLAMPDIDGGLIGGAALKLADFAAIIAAGSAK